MRLWISILILTVSSALRAEGTALLISDNKKVETSWDWCLTNESLGLNIKRLTTCYDCRLTQPTGMSSDTQRILSNRNLSELKPDVIILQLGCNDAPDSEEEHTKYESSLFDFPYGKVCTASGANARTKNIAISKDKNRITNANFAGSLYRIIQFIRETTPDTRVFFLAPTMYGHKSEADSIKISQLKEVANMFCIPFIEDLQDISRYDFIWKDIRPQLGNMLLLGDSYCQLRKWVNQMEMLAEVEVTNLGKTSATLKERANHTNTLGSQLSRIPAGCKPDVIIIEGGINDEADQERFVERYDECIEQVRRTTFAGALAYIVGRLRSRFPQARLYVVTPGGLYYGHTDKPFDFIVKANQIRKAAQLLNVPTIDWDKEGRLSFVFNNSKGTGNGSAGTPYIYNVPTRETGDLLHPSDIGAVYLAENVVKCVRQ